MSSPELKDAQPGGALERIRSLLPSLVPSERRVATAIVDNPQEVLTSSAASIAAHTGTSAATVSRACQNLGFQGYQHLRLLLARDIGARRADELPPSEHGDRGLVRAALDCACASLAEAFDTIDFEAFALAAEAIAEAGRFLIIGAGGSSPTAQATAVRFLSAEVPCEAPTDAAYQLLVAAALRPGDVCLAVSESGTNGFTLQAAKEAHRSGATVVAATGFARSALTRVADISLIAGAGFYLRQDHATGSNIVQIVVLDALFSAVMERRGRSASVSDRVVNAVAGIVRDGPDEA